MRHDHDVADHLASRPSVARAAAPAEGAGRIALDARVATPASMLRLQRLAGNVAVQRAAAAGAEVAEAAPVAPPAPAGPAAAGPAAAVGGGNTLGDGTGAVSINGPTVAVHSPMMQVDGIVRAQTVIADSVVASNYTPGAGNVW
jgi:hypothetical protein